MQQQRKKYFKRRVHWLLDPWIIGTIVFLALSGVPMVLWLSTYDSTMAVLMFVITYLTLLISVAFYIKRSLLEPEIVPDEKKVAEAKRELEEHREEVRRAYVQTELNFLSRGEQGPVLDVWRLNDKLRARHPFFSRLETVLMNPVSKELWIRIKVGRLNTQSPGSYEVESIRMHLAEFVGHLATDDYLRLFRFFFNIIVIEIYSLRDVEGSVDEPFPIYSVCLSRQDLERFVSLSPSWQQLAVVGEHRFAEGSEIQPHRGIEGGIASGLL